MWDLLAIRLLKTLHGVLDHKSMWLFAGIHAAMEFEVSLCLKPHPLVVPRLPIPEMPTIDSMSFSPGEPSLIFALAILVIGVISRRRIGRRIPMTTRCRKP